MAQVRAFSEAAASARKRHLADELVNLRASQYDANGFESYLKTLTG